MTDESDIYAQIAEAESLVIDAATERGLHDPQDAFRLLGGDQ